MTPQAPKRGHRDSDDKDKASSLPLVINPKSPTHAMFLTLLQYVSGMMPTRLLSVTN